MDTTALYIKLTVCVYPRCFWGWGHSTEPDDNGDHWTIFFIKKKFYPNTYILDQVSPVIKGVYKNLMHLPN